MIDALRQDAWPRGVRRRRRELEAAREKLRRELGHEPSLADLAAEVGSDEKRLGRTIVRINTIESTSPLASGENVDESSCRPSLVPAEPERPDAHYERDEMRDRVRAAIATLPPREQQVIGLYYYGEVTMKEIGAEIGVNESRVSQLHARAIRRLREALGDRDHADRRPSAAFGGVRRDSNGGRDPRLKPSDRPQAVVLTVTAGRRRRSRCADQIAASHRCAAGAAGWWSTQDSVSRAARSKSPSLNGLESQRQPLSSRNRSASVPATSPVTKMTRRASAGVAAASAR